MKRDVITTATIAGILLLSLAVMTPALLAEDSRTSMDFPLNVGDSVYFEDGYYKVKLVRTDDAMGFAWLNFSCEDCPYEPKELKGYQDEPNCYPGSLNQIICIKKTREVTSDRAIVNLSFPSDWTWQIIPDGSSDGSGGGGGGSGSANRVEIRGEVYDEGVNVPDADGDANTLVDWDANNFAAFWYDLDDGNMSETLIVLNTAETRSKVLHDGEIPEDTLYYNTTVQYIEYEVHDERGLIVEHGLDESGCKDCVTGSDGVSTVTGGGYYGKLGWFGEEYVALNGQPDKLVKLVLEQGDAATDKKTLTVGESWDVGGGWELEARAIDAKDSPRQAWLVLKYDGTTLDDKVLQQGQVYTYYEDSLGGETDAPIFVTYVDSVFAGATSDMVQLRYTWAVSRDVVKINSGDEFEALTVKTTANNTIVLWNEDESIDLTQGMIEPIAGAIKLRIADDDEKLRFYPMVERTEPGTYEVRGEVYDEGVNVPDADGDASTLVDWDANNFAAFWYDLDDGSKSETLAVLNTSVTRSKVVHDGEIPEDTLFYNTTVQYIEYEVHDERGLIVENGLNSIGAKNRELGSDGVSTVIGGGYYGKLGWFAEEYVALNGQPDKLVKFVFEQGDAATDKKTLLVGETWDVGGGWELEVHAIDANADPRQAWLVLKYNGDVLDNKFAQQGQVYTYYENIGGEPDAPIFVTYVDGIFADETSKAVQLRYTWAVSRDVLEINSGDEFGALTVRSTAGHKLILWNEDESINLTEGSTEPIAGAIKLRIADDDEKLRFYPVVEVTIGEGEEPEPEPLCGDLNHDGEVDMGDVILLLNHVGDPMRYPLVCWDG
ncbi:S-layer protein [Candidatus Methanoperedenaceae archaeon GB37]|nr:S-layer protein [Candidatus Methanoperedenaceae archaeon GB37]